MSKINQEEYIKIIEMYNNWVSVKEIAKKYNVSTKPIYTILKKNNVNIRKCTDRQNKSDYCTNKKYDFNQDYFENINTPEKAYWLGFLFADGNVYIPKIAEGKSKGGSVDIALKVDDDYHLYNFLNCINGNMPIKYRNIKLNDNIYKSCRLQIGSIKMATDLLNCGCIPNKSLKLEFPKFLSNDLISHFVRGYIDGDGCVFFKQYKKYDTLFVSLLGTYQFLNSIKEILFKNNIYTNDIKSEKSKAYNLTIYGRDNLINLYNYLYKDASIFLGRKIDIFRNALIYFDKNFDISESAKLFYNFRPDFDISKRRHSYKYK